MYSRLNSRCRRGSEGTIAASPGDAAGSRAIRPIASISSPFAAPRSVCATAAIRASSAGGSPVTFTQPIATESNAALRFWLPCTSPSWLPKIPYHGTSPKPPGWNGSFIRSNRPGKSRTVLERPAVASFSARLGE